MERYFLQGKLIIKLIIHSPQMWGLSFPTRKNYLPTFFQLAIYSKRAASASNFLASLRAPRNDAATLYTAPEAFQLRFLCVLFFVVELVDSGWVRCRTNINLNDFNLSGFGTQRARKFRSSSTRYVRFSRRVYVLQCNALSYSRTLRRNSKSDISFQSE